MQSAVQDHAETLREDGVVIIEDFMSASTCDNLYQEITQEVEDGNYDVVEGGNHDFNYSDFVNWGGPVVNKRSGRDEGMLDIFNVDEALPEVKSFKDDSEVKRIIDRAASKEYSPDNTNIYWNQSVQTTRDFHADSYSGQFKSFVYLTDVPTKSFGPFSYIRGTHNPSVIKRKTTKLVNKFKKKPSTDAVFYNKDDVVYCTAPKGTLIIANQSGYHRGYPQEEGKERMLMTTSYTPE